MLKNLHLLATLPDTIIVAGFGIQRSVYIDRLLLKPDYSLTVKSIAPTFDWGYRGSAPAQLALAILLNYLEGAEGKELALTLYEAFNITFVAQIKRVTLKGGVKVESAINNFHIKLQLKAFLSALAGVFKETKPASEFMEDLPLDFTIIQAGAYMSMTPNVRDENPGLFARASINIIQTGENNYELGEQ